MVLNTRAFYNEIDGPAANVLRALIAENIIMPGVVDTRSIKDINPNDLIGFTQVHLFAGGGLWSLAARMAGWPDGRELWTGSCPCQGESVAGKKLGADDPRHLWPDMHRLISACRPTVVMGEQVARSAGTNWLDGVWSDLEDDSYSFRPVVIPACAVDAPHIRERIYWLAVEHAESERRGEGRPEHEFRSGRDSATDASGMGDPESLGRRGGQDFENDRRRQCAPTDSDSRSFWAGADRVYGGDGKARRVESSIRLLANGVPRRVAQLRIGGNAIVLPLAVEFIKAFLDMERL